MFKIIPGLDGERKLVIAGEHDRATLIMDGDEITEMVADIGRNFGISEGGSYIRNQVGEAGVGDSAIVIAIRRRGRHNHLSGVRTAVDGKVEGDIVGEHAVDHAVGRYPVQEWGTLGDLGAVDNARVADHIGVAGQFPAGGHGIIGRGYLAQAQLGRVG